MFGVFIKTNILYGVSVYKATKLIITVPCSCTRPYCDFFNHVFYFYNQSLFLLFYFNMCHSRTKYSTVSWNIQYNHQNKTKKQQHLAAN